MRFFTISAVCAFAATAYAQTAGFDALTSPTQDQEVAAGSTLNIVWQPSAAYDNDTVTITLLEGSTPSTLSLGPVVASSLANSAGKYSWAIPSSIAPFATYGFKLTLDSDEKIFQYSFPFHITGTSSSSSSSATGSAASTKTMTLSTGTAYTPIPTSYSTVSSSSSANSTTIVKTSSSASTMATVTAVKPTGNSTMTYVSPTATAAQTTPATKSGSAATSAPAAITTNAAPANIASGSLALFGGLVLALAL